VAFNAPSLAKFGPSVLPGGTVVYDSSVILDPPKLSQGVSMVGVPFTKIASDLGRVVVKNVVALGALQAATRLFPEETFLTAIRGALKSRCAMIPLNEEAFVWGRKAV
jgi:Pyruvate/2-oxoacid:ferredoxin oxidoreductase gamma subunit